MVRIPGLKELTEIPTFPVGIKPRLVKTTPNSPDSFLKVE